MKIVSLVPSATELVFALGLGESLVGVTDECDFPDEATRLPVVSRSLLPPTAVEPAEVDAVVSEHAAEGRPLHAIDRELLKELEPDVVIAQDVSPSCATTAERAREALSLVGSRATVVALAARSLEDVFDSFVMVGEALDRVDEAKQLAEDSRRRVAAVRGVTSRLPSYRVLGLEWPEPPIAAGNWVPEMIEVGGGINLLSAKHEPSVRIGWKDLADATPEIVAFMPCGYYLEDAEEAAKALWDNGHFRETSAAVEGNVFAFDASSTFSRPGPRLVDALEALAWAIHPEAFPEPPAGTVTRVRR